MGLFPLLLYTEYKDILLLSRVFRVSDTEILIVCVCVFPCHMANGRAKYDSIISWPVLGLMVKLLVNAFVVD